MEPLWVKPFNGEGVVGLDDGPRSGRRLSHPREVECVDQPDTAEAMLVGVFLRMVALERLKKATAERHAVHLSDSTIWTWMEEEARIGVETELVPRS